jgi:hypothetical protein
MSNDLVPSNDLPSPSSGGGGDRVSEIRSIMATDRARYFREDLGTELAQIRAGDPVTLRPGDSKASLMASDEGRELVAAWGSAFPDNLRAVQNMVLGMVRDLGGSNQGRALMASFDLDVPERARYHIYDELRQPAPAASPVSVADMTTFAKSGVGRDLIAEWGSAAPGMIGRVWARVKRFRAALDDEVDFELFRDWYDHLPADTVKAILRQLAR